MSAWIATLIAIASSLWALRSGVDPALAVATLDLIALSMIFRPNWWTFWLPLGFWEQRASDSNQADRQGPAIVFIGWIALLLSLLLALKT